MSSRYIVLAAIAGMACGQVINRSRIPQNYDTPSVTTNFAQTHSEPALPNPGPAGTIFKDPTFGNRILRVSDGNTLASRGYANDSVTSSSSSESSLWRKDGTMFYVGSPVTGGIILFNFDPVRFQATDSGQASPGSSFLQVGGSPEFSYNDNNALYGAPSLSFSRYDVVQHSTTSLFSFNTAIPGLTGSAGDPSVSALDLDGQPDDCLAAPTNGPSQDNWTAVVVWCKNTGQYAVLDFKQGLRGFGQPAFTPQTTGPNWDPTWTIHNARIGKEGRYVAISTHGNAAPFQEIWDLELNTATGISGTLISGHKAQGYGSLASCAVYANDHDYGPQLTLIKLNAPSTFLNMLPINTAGPGPGGLCDYASWQNADPSISTPLFGSNESTGGPGTSGQSIGTGEAVAVSTDQVSQRVWRLATMHAPYGQGPLYSGVVTVNNGGTGYNVNDTGAVSGCGTTDATYTVTAAVAGTVSAVTINSGGMRYSSTSGCATRATSGSGTGLTLNIASSIWNNFYDTTRGAVSQNGRYFLFNSTWDGTLGAPADRSNAFRTDVFIVELTPLTPAMDFRVVAGSTRIVFLGLAPDMQTCTATVYSDAGRTVQVARGSDTIRDGRTSQIVLSGLTPETPYWTSVTCGGNRTILSNFTTREPGAGLYRFPFLLPSSQPGKYCLDAAMSSNCTSLASGTKQIIPVTANSTVYARFGTSGPITALITP